MLSPKFNTAISELAELFYTFLPASGRKSWKGHVTFSTVATECDVAHFWQGGSKMPAIVNLLEKTYVQTNGSFERLVIAIVNRGIVYRKKKNDPITREEMENINKIILRLERKFPTLWDNDFLESLPSEKKTVIDEKINQEVVVKYDHEIFKERFHDLMKEENKQQAGRNFESFLYDLFKHFGLNPHAPFSIKGEQIDGSFELDHATYLIEAKWQQGKTQEKDLLIFRGKIEGKSAFTRGIFVSLSGYTENAVEALCRGKQPIFFLIEGEELFYLLCNKANLIEMLRFKRRAMDEGNILKRHPNCKSIVY